MSFMILQRGGLGRLGPRSNSAAAVLRLQLDMEGSHGSTTFIDSSPFGRTVTPAGNAQITTAQFKIGTSSAAFDGTGDVLTIADAIDLRPGTQDFTLGCYARLNSTAATAIILSKGTGTGFYPWQIWFDAATGRFRTRGFNASDVMAFNLGDAGPVASAGVWYYLTTTRSGGTFRWWIDGTLIASSTVGASTELHQTTGPVCVGAFSNGVSSLNGQIDYVQYYTGPALYTSNFTPPT